jgi:hypothetical protein
MSSRYIRAQALTLTKAHEERIGPLSAIAKSAKCYGHADPVVAFSDDPVKVYQYFNLLNCLLNPFLVGQKPYLLSIPFSCPESYSSFSSS